MSALREADLVGAWELLSFEVAYSDGRPRLQPFGADARGQLIYTADGRMSAVLARGDREPLAVSLETVNKAPPEARAEAFSSYVSYAGRYRLEGQSVVHTVELALVPDAVGRENVRLATLEGERLVLSYERTPPSGVVRTYALTWRRCSAR